MRVVHFLSAWLVTKILAASTNRTIDDTNGDSMTGAIPVYQPNESGVWAGPSCVGCAIVPDTSLAHDGTWSAATYNAGLGIMNISMDFTGTAVYVFFILANFQDEGITTTTKASFSVDGVQRGTFDHVPSDSFELQYDQLVFAETGLANTPHRLVVWTVADTDIYVNFDYALYTFEDVEQNPPTTTTAQLPPTHPIASTPSTSMPMASSTKSHFSSALNIHSVLFTELIPIYLHVPALDTTSTSTSSNLYHCW
ncbi:hypothetical protein MIND_00837400 [Mycena indigotica]|uniref:Uncharacterized protein n=1 Tax=Mycena indigotica TaxID=2126181 RepID=A0A8H6SGD0_9AGAR|nr:uncharacterized protein MIND_00837400 [Mycena indigotica]KAF7298894.1 hypothetical protein MIND_00837400 [Mycena indigotica]